MPANLTGNKVQDIYSSFLHLSGDNLTGNLESVFDGIGNKTPMQVSTEQVLLSKNVSLSGLVSINNNIYPSTLGEPGQVIAVDSAGVLSFNSIVNVLNNSPSQTVSIPNGTYSNPVIVYNANMAVEVRYNPSIKTFFVRDQALTTDAATQVIQTDWPHPVTGDIARVLNLADNKVYNYKYNSSYGWGQVNSI